MVVGPFLWIAPEHHYEFMHFDPDDGLLIVLEGFKTVNLISPEYLDSLYLNPLGSYGRTVQSQVILNSSEPGLIRYDNAKYPKFGGVHVWTGKLEKGDCLYIPAVSPASTFFLLLHASVLVLVSSDNFREANPFSKCVLGT